MRLLLYVILVVIFGGLGFVAGYFGINKEKHQLANNVTKVEEVGPASNVAVVEKEQSVDTTMFVFSENDFTQSVTKEGVLMTVQSTYSSYFPATFQIKVPVTEEGVYRIDTTWRCGIKNGVKLGITGVTDVVQSGIADEWQRMQFDTEAAGGYATYEVTVVSGTTLGTVLFRSMAVQKLTVREIDSSLTLTYLDLSTMISGNCNAEAINNQIVISPTINGAWTAFVAYPVLFTPGTYRLTVNTTSTPASVYKVLGFMKLGELLFVEPPHNSITVTVEDGNKYAFLMTGLYSPITSYGMAIDSIVLTKIA